MQKSLDFAFSFAYHFFCSKLYFIITQKVNFFYELNIFKNYVFAPESKLSKVQFQKHEKLAVEILIFQMFRLNFLTFREMNSLGKI